MPTRLLKEGILDSDAVNSMSLRGEVFYRRLMSIADDYGRCDARLELLRARLFALQFDHWTLEDVEAALQECAEAKRADGSTLVRRYEVSGRQYLEITNFGQRARTKSKFPEPPGCHAAADCGQMPAAGGQMTANDSPTRGRGRTYSDAESDTKSKSDAQRECAHDPEPGLRRFEAEAKRLAPDRWQSHPAESAWVEVVTSPAIEAQVFAGLEHWRGSKQWADGVFHRWDRWLRELRFTEETRQAGETDAQSNTDRTREADRATITRAAERFIAKRGLDRPRD